MPCFSCFTFHFHQIAGLKDSIVMTMMLMRPVWVLWAVWYFSEERGSLHEETLH